MLQKHLFIPQRINHSCSRARSNEQSWTKSVGTLRFILQPDLRIHSEKFLSFNTPGNNVRVSSACAAPNLHISVTVGPCGTP